MKDRNDSDHFCVSLNVHRTHNCQLMCKFQRRQSEKIVGAEGVWGETHIRVEGGVLLGGESSQKL